MILFVLFYSGEGKLRINGSWIPTNCSWWSSMFKKSSAKCPISGLRELRVQMYLVSHILLEAAVEVRCYCSQIFKFNNFTSGNLKMSSCRSECNDRKEAIYLLPYVSSIVSVFSESSQPSCQSTLWSRSCIEILFSAILRNTSESYSSFITTWYSRIFYSKRSFSLVM